MQHHAGLKHSIEGGSHGHGVARKSVQEVRRPIERVYDPYQPVGHHIRTQLLTHHSSTGIAGEQYLGDQAFCRPVDLGHEIAAALEGPSAWICRPAHCFEILSRTQRCGLCQMQ
jgi:hypothetical protein